MIIWIFSLLKQNLIFGPIIDFGHTVRVTAAALLLCVAWFHLKSWKSPFNSTSFCSNYGEKDWLLEESQATKNIARYLLRSSPCDNSCVRHYQISGHPFFLKFWGLGPNFKKDGKRYLLWEKLDLILHMIACGLIRFEFDSVTYFNKFLAWHWTCKIRFKRMPGKAAFWGSLRPF